MEIFALSPAATTTIVYILIWVVLFPAFVTGLIAFAVFMARGEASDNAENRRFPRL
jgi:hypothetical protein